MAQEEVQRGVVSRLLTNCFKAFGDGQQSNAAGVRISPYGEQATIVSLSPKQTCGDEGSYFFRLSGRGCYRIAAWALCGLLSDPGGSGAC